MRFEASLGDRGDGHSGRIVRQTAHAAAIAAISGALLWLVWVYASALRDPRYLDGWILTGGMALQLAFHIVRKSPRLPPKSAARWRKFHIFLGYVLIAAFISHSDFSLPDTAFEWALSASFVVVTLSGIFGAYLAWSQRIKRKLGDGASAERIQSRSAELAAEVFAIVRAREPADAAAGLPAPPHEAWISDLYESRLKEFFERPGRLATHFSGSQRRLARLMAEIDSLARYVDQGGAAKLASIKSMVAEKEQLDFANAHIALTRAWLFVHVPATYALFALTALHILVAYSFSSGAW